MAQLGRLGSQPWAVVELTVPRDAALQDRIFGDDDLRNGLWRAAWRTAQGVLVKWAFRGQAVQLGCALFVHPAGDDEDVAGFHVHLLVPLIGVGTLSGQIVTGGRYKLPREALVDLRAWWKRCLVEDFGIEVRGAVNVHYGFRLAGTSVDDMVERGVVEAKRNHSARYVARTFPTWSEDVQRPHYLGLLSPAGRKIWNAANEARAAAGKDPIEPAPLPPSLERLTLCDVCGCSLVSGPWFHAHGDWLYHAPPGGGPFYPTSDRRARSAADSPAEAWTVRPHGRKPT